MFSFAVHYPAWNVMLMKMQTDDAVAGLRQTDRTGCLLHDVSCGVECWIMQ
jgi:hypothetical protein